GADAAARAGDERDLAVESQVHGESTILPGTARVVARGDPGLEPRSPRGRRTQSRSPGRASIPGFALAHPGLRAADQSPGLGAVDAMNSECAVSRSAYAHSVLMRPTISM